MIMLVVNKVVFPRWCLTGSHFPANALEISYFKILPWQPNKMGAGHKPQKLCGLSANDHLPNMVHITSLVMEKMQFKQN